MIQRVIKSSIHSLNYLFNYISISIPPPKRPNCARRHRPLAEWTLNIPLAPPIIPPILEYESACTRLIFRRNQICSSVEPPTIWCKTIIGFGSLLQIGHSSQAIRTGFCRSDSITEKRSSRYQIRAELGSLPNTENWAQFTSLTEYLLCCTVMHFSKGYNKMCFPL